MEVVNSTFKKIDSAPLRKSTTKSLKENRTPEAPPFIEPVSFLEIRPLISIMIPTYNCISYVEYALTSVLAQDLGPTKMQIEVIDDCSTDGDLEKLVNKIGKGRVKFYKQPYNKGSLRNFETCINRAKGHWIHILHGDDYVMSGFYDKIINLINAFPEVGAAFTNNFYQNEHDPLLMPGKKIKENDGILNNWLSEIAVNNKLQTPSIVVKRSVYEHLGSFYAVHYGEDWEMWARIAQHYSFAYSPVPLAVYCSRVDNISSDHFSKGQVVEDIKKVISIVQGYLPENKKQSIKKESLKVLSSHFTSVFCNKIFSNKIAGQSFFSLIKIVTALHFSWNNILLLSKEYLRYLIVWKILNRQKITASNPKPALELHL